MQQKLNTLLTRRLLSGLLYALVAAILVYSFVSTSLSGRAAAIASIAILLWITEIVPAFVPTLFLLASIPLLLMPFGSNFDLSEVMNWIADPVLVLFFGGFCISIAACNTGLDRFVVIHGLRLSKGSPVRLLIIVLSISCGLSMWISNIAAAAMLLAALRPLLSSLENSSIRRALLLAIAFGANLGGMATPIGTGPNALAISAASRYTDITFLGWMTFAVPLVMGLLILVSILLTSIYSFDKVIKFSEPALSIKKREAKTFLIIFFLTLVGWLTETFHGISSASIALMSTTLMFATGLLESRDIFRVDWATLILIAGGLILGNLLFTSGLIRIVTAPLEQSVLSSTVQLGILITITAMLSALMSNTATATIIIPIAISLIPSPSTPILIAIAASLGVPFVISTPPNAMVYGEGGLKAMDIFLPGTIIMILGCLLITLTGPYVLNILNIG
jgi:solute carrier family 13 (sodium-dependent dicarboxylate transporter), member 2/3/5